MKEYKLIKKEKILTVILDHNEIIYKFFIKEQKTNVWAIIKILSRTSTGELKGTCQTSRFYKKERKTIDVYKSLKDEFFEYGFLKGVYIYPQFGFVVKDIIVKNDEESFQAIVSANNNSYVIEIVEGSDSTTATITYTIKDNNVCYDKKQIIRTFVKEDVDKIYNSLLDELRKGSNWLNKVA